MDNKNKKQNYMSKYNKLRLGLKVVVTEIKIRIRIRMERQMVDRELEMEMTITTILIILTFSVSFSKMRILQKKKNLEKVVSKQCQIFSENKQNFLDLNHKLIGYKKINKTKAKIIEEVLNSFLRHCINSDTISQEETKKNISLDLLYIDIFSISMMK